MTDTAVRIARLDADAVEAAADALGGVLLDCVAGGASVSFMAGLTAREARAFFLGCARDVRNGDRLLLAAYVDGVPSGTVQVVLAMPPNQPHRADLSKLLVRRAARGRGLGRALVTAAEREAGRCGKSLVCLDTASDAAERVYQGLGYTRVGTIPGYALWPDGRPCDTVFYWKAI